MDLNGSGVFAALSGSGATDTLAWARSGWYNDWLNYHNQIQRQETIVFTKEKPFGVYADGGYVNGPFTAEEADRYADERADQTKGTAYIVKAIATVAPERKTVKTAL